MKKHILISVLNFILLSNLYCQTFFREGYLVKRNGEIINGLIKFSPGDNIPKVCSFKRFDIAENIIYKPTEIKGFGYKNGKRYESITIDGKAAFCEIIVTGKLKLSQKGSRYFIEKDNNGITELNNGKKVTGPDNTKYNAPADFIKFITEGKVPGLNENIDLGTDLIRIVTDYNKISGSDYQVSRRTMSKKEFNNEAMKSGDANRKIGILAGMSVNSLTLSVEKTYAYCPVPGIEYTPAFGISYEKNIFRRTNKFTLYSELLYINHKTYWNNITPVSGRLPTYDDVFINYSGIKIPVMMQYTLTGLKYSPYFGAGASLFGIVNYKYKHINEAMNYENEIFTSEDRNIKLNPAEIAGVFSCGIKIRFMDEYQADLKGMIEIGQGLIKDTFGINSGFKQMSIRSTILIGISF